MTHRLWFIWSRCVELSNGQLTNKDLATMILQAGRIWLSQLIRQAYAHAFVSSEVPLECFLWKVTLELLANDNAQFLIQRDQAGIESNVMKRRKTQTVSWAEPICRKVAPWFNMAGDQELWDGNPGNAAAQVVSRQHSLPEELLSATNFDSCLSFSRPARRDKSHLVARKEVHFLCVIVSEQVVQQLLALRSKCGKTGVKLIPHRFVLFRRTGQATNSASALHRIKSREIAELHCQTVWRPAHFPRSVHNDGIALVQLPERKFAVEIQRDEEVLARPFHGRSLCHAVKLHERPIPITQPASTRCGFAMLL